VQNNDPYKWSAQYPSGNARCMNAGMMPYRRFSCVRSVLSGLPLGATFISSGCWKSTQSITRGLCGLRQAFLSTGRSLAA